MLWLPDSEGWGQLPAEGVLGCQWPVQTDLINSSAPHCPANLIEIIKRWAVAGKTDTYKALSEELDGVGYTVPYFSRLMSVLLESACREEARTGSSAMLTAIVVNKGTRAPSDQFGELAKTSPFHRDREPGWT